MLALTSGCEREPRGGWGQGFDFAFVIDFVDAAARDAYLEDDVHRAFGADLVAALDGGTDGLGRVRRRIALIRVAPFDAIEVDRTPG